jgi:hypothetical protein
MIVHRLGLSNKGVGRYQCRDGGKQGEEAVTHHAGGDREEAVFTNLLEGSPKNVLPSLARNLSQGAGIAPAAQWDAAPLAQRN